MLLNYPLFRNFKISISCYSPFKWLLILLHCVNNGCTQYTEILYKFSIETCNTVKASYLKHISWNRPVNDFL